MSSVCRVCLTGGGNVTLCSLEDVWLQDVYKKLTNTQFHSEDRRPRVVCSLCHKNLLRCWNLSEKALTSENILSNLLFKGLEATRETIENLNLGTNLHLMRTIDMDNETPKTSSAIIIKEEPVAVKEEVPVVELATIIIKEEPVEVKEEVPVVEMATIIIKEEPVEVKEEVPVVEFATIIIKEEPVEVKEEVTVQVDELVGSESGDTLISEECLKNQLICEEGSNNGHYLTEESPEIDIVQQNLETDTEKLDLDQEQSKNHQTKKIDTEVNSYACSICDKQFNVRCNLVRHMRIHTGVKSHACSICDKQFKTKFNLVRHMRVHTGVKPYPCSICAKQFQTKFHLVMHMRIHTGEKPHACSICDRQFKEKSTLVTHMRIHTGEKPYACSLCIKQFKQRSTLVRHMSVHTGVKHYACSGYM